MKIAKLILVPLLFAFITSCSTLDSFHGGSLCKRKYRPGWYFENNTKVQEHKSSPNNTTVTQVNQPHIGVDKNSQVADSPAQECLDTHVITNAVKCILSHCETDVEMHLQSSYVHNKSTVGERAIFQGVNSPQKKSATNAAGLIALTAMLLLGVMATNTRFQGVVRSEIKKGGLTIGIIVGILIAAAALTMIILFFDFGLLSPLILAMAGFFILGITLIILCTSRLNKINNPTKSKSEAKLNVWALIAFLLVVLSIPVPTLLIFTYPAALLLAILALVQMKRNPGKYKGRWMALVPLYLIPIGLLVLGFILIWAGLLSAQGG